MFNMLSNFLRVVFTSGIIDGKEEIESGGPQCENYMSYQYRLLVSTIMVSIFYLLNILLLIIDSYLYCRLQKNIKKCKRRHYEGSHKRD